MSTWPAAWTDFCSRPVFLGIRLPVFGDKTTNVQVMAPPGGTMPNQSLDQTYARIVNSTGFKNASAGFGWVTIHWGLQEAGPVGSLSEYAIGQFLLISGGRPSYLFWNYPGRLQFSGRGPCQSSMESALAARLG
jgi:hypothetical protein